MKPVKEKGSLEEDSYQMLTSNLQNAYESAFGDISDLVLTGYIDRNLETVGEGENAKKYATTEIRKLYFRGTSLIDAGSRFAPEAVPEYMIFDKMDMGEEFVRVIEDGIKNSKTINSTPKPTKTTKKPEPAPVVVEETVDEIDEIDEIDTTEEVTTGVKADEIRALFKKADKDTRAKVKEIIAEFGGELVNANQEGLNRMHEILTA